LVKSQKLPENILTPTTKAADHDVPVTPDEVGLFDSLCHFKGGREGEVNSLLD
jgi:phosphoribosylaminoimidazole-succinocarboxamide synthase